MDCNEPSGGETLLMVRRCLKPRPTATSRRCSGRTNQTGPTTSPSAAWWGAACAAAIGPCCGSPQPRGTLWLGLLMPLCLQPSSAVLVLTEAQKRRLLQVERPRLQNQGFRLACWSGASPPPSGQIWLLDHAGLIRAHRNQQLQQRSLLIPDIDQLSSRLRRQMAVRIDATHWEELRQALPQADQPCFSSTSGSAASCSAKPPGPTPAFAWMAVPFKACAICSGFWGHCPHPGRNSWPPILINGPAGLNWITSSCSGAGA